MTLEWVEGLVSTRAGRHLTCTQTKPTWWPADDGSLRSLYIHKGAVCTPEALICATLIAEEHTGLSSPVLSMSNTSALRSFYLLYSWCSYTCGVLHKKLLNTKYLTMWQKTITAATVAIFPLTLNTWLDSISFHHSVLQWCVFTEGRIWLQLTNYTAFFRLLFKWSIMGEVMAMWKDWKGANVWEKKRTHI